MTPPRSYKARGVVLRSRPLGEADRILTLFTAEHGRIDAVAKGIRRARSRMGGQLQFGNECAFGMHRGRSLDVIATADLVTARWERLVHPASFAVASLLAELVVGFCEPDLAVDEVYVLLNGALDALGRVADPRSLLPRFGMRLLDALGTAPPVDRCVRCMQPLATRAYLDAEGGGMIDEACREPWRDMPLWDGDDLANLRALAAPRDRAGAVLVARPQVARGVEALLMHQLGRRPKASALIGGLGETTA